MEKNNDLVEKIFNNYRAAWIEVGSQNIVLKAQLELQGDTIKKLEEEKIQLQIALNESNNKFLEITKQHDHLANEATRKLQETITLYSDTIADREQTIKQRDDKIAALIKQIEELKNLKIPVKLEKQ